jgi:hypothetical protein
MDRFESERTKKIKMPKTLQKPTPDHCVAANDTPDTASIKCNDVPEKLNEMCDRKDECQRWMVMFLQKFTGHRNIMDCFCSYEQLVRFMYQPCDGASLGIGRMMFGECFCDQEGIVNLFVCSSSLRSCGFMRLSLKFGNFSFG